MHSDLEKMRFSLTNGKDNENLSFNESSISEEENFQNCSVPQYDTSDVLTIEGLRRNYNSCSDCGVCWYEDHVNLDCSQCGGYAMCRPCPKCNGQCGVTWRRDVTASHRNNKAEWVGSCSLDFQWDSSELLDSNNLSEDKNANLEHSYHHHLDLKAVKTGRCHFT